MSKHDPIEPTRRRALAGIGATAAVLVPACRRGWVRPEDDPTSRSQVKPYVPGADDFATYEERRDYFEDLVRSRL